MVKEYKINPKALRKIAIDKFGCSVIASLDDNEVKDKIMHEYTLIKEVDSNKIYLIAKSQLNECIVVESEK